MPRQRPGKRSRQPLRSAAVTPSSRDTSSRSSPRSKRSTASCLRRADIRRRCPGVGPPPPACWARSDGPTPTPTSSSILHLLAVPICKSVSRRTVGRGNTHSQGDLPKLLAQARVLPPVTKRGPPVHAAPAPGTTNSTIVPCAGRHRSLSYRHTDRRPAVGRAFVPIRRWPELRREGWHSAPRRGRHAI